MPSLSSDRIINLTLNWTDLEVPGSEPVQFLFLNKILDGIIMLEEEKKSNNTDKHVPFS